VFDSDESYVAGSDIDNEDLSGTVNWRLSWWQDIINYTVFGDEFWTGRGFGINIAAIDGYGGGPESLLRSPHSAHMTILARTGVPGLILWIAAHLSFVGGLILYGMRMRRQGAHGWVKLNVWLMAYWFAAIVNGSFDVYLEGPQGGIWFWCLIGFGFALMYVERQAYRRGRQLQRAAALQGGV